MTFIIFLLDAIHNSEPPALQVGFEISCEIHAHLVPEGFSDAWIILKVHQPFGNESFSLPSSLLKSPSASSVNLTVQEYAIGTISSVEMGTRSDGKPRFRLALTLSAVSI
jgi:hypothetical protein